LQKALYGLMRASLLFYRKLQKELEEYGFEVNPYDPCVANKMTDSAKQMSFVWHVDDLMGSCGDDFELTKIVVLLSKDIWIKAHHGYRAQTQLSWSKYGVQERWYTRSVNDTLS
jgi:hypothetical protein